MRICRELLFVVLPVLPLLVSCIGETVPTEDKKSSDAGPEGFDYGPQAEKVDQFWGDAPDVETRLAIYSDLWTAIGDGFGGFVVTDLDWNEVDVIYRPQIEAAESFGRFYALLSELFFMLQDSHSKLVAASVCGSSPEYLAQRPPIFRAAGYRSSLGACVTPLDDDRLLVYRVEADNPAGLMPGDVILGYDGVAWRHQLETILDWRLPICGALPPTESAYDNRMMESAMNNAHLFEQLDVVRHGTTQTEQVPTAGLLSFDSAMVCSDQVGVEGVEFPWTSLADFDTTGAGNVTWGILPGTNIGYIYAYCWLGAVQQDFETAVSDLMDTDGLIIDFRLNFGGSSTVAMDGLSLLFSEDQIDVYNGWQRNPSVDDYNAMIPFNQGAYDIDADESTAYAGPIALLTGPHAVSAGDGVAHLTSLHPNVRRFGRATAGAFGYAGTHWSPDPHIGLLETSISPGILSGPDGEWLYAAPQYIDDSVWLSPDDVAQGVDTVVEAAITWIEQ